VLKVFLWVRQSAASTLKSESKKGKNNSAFMADEKRYSAAG
jgi:hypothetical protein